MKYCSGELSFHKCIIPGAMLHVWKSSQYTAHTVGKYFVMSHSSYLQHHTYRGVSKCTKLCEREIVSYQIICNDCAAWSSSQWRGRGVQSINQLLAHLGLVRMTLKGKKIHTNLRTHHLDILLEEVGCHIVPSGSSVLLNNQKNNSFLL